MAVLLVPYLADTSAGVGTLRDCSRRLPGFTGPIPSTSLDKAIKLLAAIVWWGMGGCQEGWIEALAGARGLSGRACIRTATGGEGRG